MRRHLHLVDPMPPTAGWKTKLVLIVLLAVFASVMIKDYSIHRDYANCVAHKGGEACKALTP